MILHVNFKEEYEGNFLKLSCHFNLNNIPKEIWFKVPIEYADYTSDLADSFLIGLLFVAMEHRHKIKIHDKKISKGLVLNLMEFQRAWHKWNPEKYAIIDIEAIESTEKPHSGESAISAFTGGVDSAFILYQNVVAASSRSFYIGGSLFIHGFDIPLAEQNDFDKSLEDIRHVTDSLHIPLIYMQTNLRDFGDWNDTHGAAIIACLTLFNKHFQIGLLGSSHPYNYLRFPWGSNPISDPLLSSKSFRIYNYGGGYSRVEKLREIANWPTCNEYLRVCTKYFYKNCGVCEKCVRTKLGFWVLHKKLPPTFKDASINPISVVRILAFKDQEIMDYKSLYHVAKLKYKLSPVTYSLAINLQINRLIRFLNVNLLRNVTFSPKLIRGLKRFFTS